MLVLCVALRIQYYSSGSANMTFLFLWALCIINIGIFIIYPFLGAWQICLWCWHHIMEMDQKDESGGKCPGCRSVYNKDRIMGTSVGNKMYALLLPKCSAIPIKIHFFGIYLFSFHKNATLWIFLPKEQ